MFFFSAAISLPGGLVNAQDSDDPAEAPQQDDVSKALDSTATQWSFQFAYQWMTW